MRRVLLPRVGRWIRWIVPMVAWLGCSAPEPPPAVRPKPDRPLKLGDYLPPLDKGRIEVAPPAGWHVPSRSQQFLVRFTQSRQESYPSIVLTAEDYEEIAEVTEENLDEFRNEVEGRLLEEGGGSSGTAGSLAVEPVRVGTFVGVSYRGQAKAKADLKTIALERILLETVVGGRKYTLELRAEAGTAAQWWPHLWAVAGGIRFHHRSGRPAPDAPQEAPKSKETEKDRKEDKSLSWNSACPVVLSAAKHLGRSASTRSFAALRMTNTQDDKRRPAGFRNGL